MKTIRRLYFYLVALVSLEVVAWALISLARSMFDGTLSDVLAGGLAFILVGFPVFLFHWRAVQREAQADNEERFSGVRAVFLYAAWISLAIPVIQNLLAIVLRILAAIFDVNRETVSIGGYQGWADNLIAIAVNAILAAYIYSILKKDWQANPPEEAFPLVRRINRYIWVLYGLGLAFTGSVQLLQYIFGQLNNLSTRSAPMLVNSFGLIAVGIPVWFYSWGIAQKSASDPDSRREEHFSQIRRGVLYGLALMGALAALLTIGSGLYLLLRVVFVPHLSFNQSWNEINMAISIMLPSLAVWTYHWSTLKKDIGLIPSTLSQHIQRRLYFYLLSLVGLVGTFIGLQMLVSLLSDVIFCSSKNTLQTGSCSSAIESLLPNAIAILLVSVPLWVLHWRPAQGRAAGDDELGENARSSLLRKVYLYLLLFTGVLGSMFTSGWLLYELISALLNISNSNLLKTIMVMLGTLGLFLVFTIYHWRLLRQDGVKTDQTIAAQQLAYPVMIVSQSELFGDQVSQALSALTPNIPQIMQTAGQPLVEGVEQAKAVILSAEILITGDQTLNAWLRNFSGARLVLPTPTPGWVWLGLTEQKLERQARQVAKSIQQLAEAGEAKSARSLSPGAVLGYVLAGIIGFSAFCTLTSFILENLT